MTSRYDLEGSVQAHFLPVLKSPVIGNMVGKIWKSEMKIIVVGWTQNAHLCKSSFFALLKSNDAACSQHVAESNELALALKFQTSLLTQFDVFLLQLSYINLFLGLSSCHEN